MDYCGFVSFFSFFFYLHQDAMLNWLWFFFILDIMECYVQQLVVFILLDIMGCYVN